LKPVTSAITLAILITLQSSVNSAELVKKISPAIVLIKGGAASSGLQGSGFLISRDGRIATNLHVIRDLKSAGVQLASGEIYDSFAILAFDERKDLAIIKIAGFDLPYIELGNSNESRVGDSILVLGSPRGLQGSVSSGIISAIRDDPADRGFKLIQVDAAMNPGNSGGPVGGCPTDS